MEKEAAQFSRPVTQSEAEGAFRFGCSGDAFIVEEQDRRDAELQARERTASYRRRLGMRRLRVCQTRQGREAIDLGANGAAAPFNARVYGIKPRPMTAPGEFNVAIGATLPLPLALVTGAKT